jgi:hypothetical protein
MLDKNNLTSQKIDHWSIKFVLFVVIFLSLLLSSYQITFALDLASCGSSQGITTQSAPTSGLCNVGDLMGPPQLIERTDGSSEWQWGCRVEGSPASCNNYTSTNKIYEAFYRDYCQYNPWYYPPISLNPGNTASCSAPRPTPPPPPTASGGATLISFTASDTSLPAKGGDVTFKWSAQNTNGWCRLSRPGWAPIDVRASDGETGIAFRVTENNTYSMTCFGIAGYQNNTINIPVYVAPSIEGMSVQLTADPTISSYEHLLIPSGSKVNIGWYVKNAISCSGSGDWSGTKAIPTGYETTIEITSFKTFTLTCTNGVESVSKIVMVSVLPPQDILGTSPGMFSAGTDLSPPQTPSSVYTAPVPNVPAPTITSFSVTPSEVFKGEPVTISWNSQNTGICYVFGEWYSVEGPSGTKNVTSNIVGSKDITLVCHGSNTSIGGTDSRTISVTYKNPPPTPAAVLSVELSSTKSANNYTTYDLTYSSKNATECHLNKEPVGQAPTTIDLEKNKTGTLTGVLPGAYGFWCRGANSQNLFEFAFLAERYDSPGTVPLTFTASKDTIRPGETVKLTWNSIPTLKCTLGPERISSSGSIDVSQPGSYTIICVDSVQGLMVDSKTIQIRLDPNIPPPDVTFTSVPANGKIKYGESFESLTYSSPYADYCVVSINGQYMQWRWPSSFTWSKNDPATKDKTGPYTSPAEFAVYCLNANGVQASNSFKFELTDIPPPLPPPQISTSISQSTLRVGEKLKSLEFTSTGAEYCDQYSDSGRKLLVSKGPTSYKWTDLGPFTEYQEWIFRCFNKDGLSAEESVAMTSMPPEPVITFDADRSEVMHGETINLDWTSKNAIFCTINGSQVPMEGRQSVKVANSWGDKSEKYNFSCNGPGGTVSREVTVWVKPPAALPDIILSVSQNSVNLNALGAESCDQYVNGELAVSKGPSSKVWTDQVMNSGQTWKFICYNRDGKFSEKSIQLVSNNSPDVFQIAIHISPESSIPYGGYLDEVSYAAKNAKYCEYRLDGVSDGRRYPASYTWNRENPSPVLGPFTSNKSLYIYCMHLDGITETSSQMRILRVGEPMTVTSNVEFTTNKTSAIFGETINLAWSTVNVLSCKGTGDWDKPSLQRNGNLDYKIESTEEGNKTFSIVCTGPTGDITKSITVNVTEEASTPNQPESGGIFSGIVNAVTNALGISNNTTQPVSPPPVTQPDQTSQEDIQQSTPPPPPVAPTGSFFGNLVNLAADALGISEPEPVISTPPTPPESTAQTSPNTNEKTSGPLGATTITNNVGGNTYIIGDTVTIKNIVNNVPPDSQLCMTLIGESGYLPFPNSQNQCKPISTMNGEISTEIKLESTPLITLTSGEYRLWSVIKQANPSYSLIMSYGGNVPPIAEYTSGPFTITDREVPPPSLGSLIGGFVTSFVETVSDALGISEKIPVTAQVASADLGLSYDDDEKESLLSAKFTISITAGSNEMKINKPDALYSGDFGSMYVDLVNINGDASGVYPWPTITSQSENVIDNNTHWTIPAGQTGTFTVLNAYETKKLFAGSYLARLTLSENGEAYTLANNQTNSVTVIGEVSPYITEAVGPSIEAGKDGSITVTGVRFHSTSNEITVSSSENISGKKITLSSTNNKTTVKIPLKEVGIKTSGFYAIQITHPTTGASNLYGIEINTLPVAEKGSDESDETTPPIETADLKINEADQLLTIGDNEEITVNWTSTGAESCYVTNVRPNKGEPSQSINLPGTSGSATLFTALSDGNNGIVALQCGNAHDSINLSLPESSGGFWGGLVDRVSDAIGIIPKIEDPELQISSPPSQFVVGNSTFTIATFKIKTNTGTAIVRELNFKIIGEDAIQTITVGGITKAAFSSGDSAVTSIAGLTIPINSTGVDIPVMVKFSGFQGAPDGGSLVKSVNSVGIVLSYIEAVAGSENIITNKTPVSSNLMSLVASKPTLIAGAGNGPNDFLYLDGKESKVGELTVKADTNAKLSVSHFKINLSSTGLINTTFSNFSVSDGNGTAKLPIENTTSVTEGSNIIIKFTQPYEIGAGQSRTFSVYAKVSGTQTVGTSPQVISNVNFPGNFSWYDVMGGNTLQGGTNIFNFPTNSFRTGELYIPPTTTNESDSTPSTTAGVDKKTEGGESQAMPVTLVTPNQQNQANTAAVDIEEEEDISAPQITLLANGQTALSTKHVEYPLYYKTVNVKSCLMTYSPYGPDDKFVVEPNAVKEIKSRLFGSYTLTCEGTNGVTLSTQTTINKITDDDTPSFFNQTTEIAQSPVSGVTQAVPSQSITVSSIFKPLTNLFPKKTTVVEAVPRPTVSFTATPSEVDYDGSSLLSWITQNATECRSSGGAWPLKYRAVLGTFPVENIIQDKTFLITCSGEGGQTQQEVRIRVKNIPKVTFPPAVVSTNPSVPKTSSLPIGAPKTGTPKVLTPVKSAPLLDPKTPTVTFIYNTDANNNVILKWDTKNVQSCSATDGWSGTITSVPINGTKNVGQLVDGKKYTIKCDGIYSVTKSVTTRKRGIL